jgi:hypothetical protein
MQHTSYHSSAKFSGIFLIIFLCIACQQKNTENQENISENKPSEEIETLRKVINLNFTPKSVIWTYESVVPNCKNDLGTCDYRLEALIETDEITIKQLIAQSQEIDNEAASVGKTEKILFQWLPEEKRQNLSTERIVSLHDAAIFQKTVRTGHFFVLSNQMLVLTMVTN